jgi:hypothetical protein
MSDFKTRLAEEKAELETKCHKLTAFTQSEAFEKLDYDNSKLLRVQLNAMNTYLEVLEMRIDKLGA